MADGTNNRPSAFLPDVGITPGSHAELVLTGADRASFLHNFCTNDIKRLQPGEGCEAFVTNVKGRILDHIFVFASADQLSLRCREGRGEALRGHLDRYLITEDVQLDLRGEQRAHLTVFGRDAAAAIQSVTGTAVDGWSPYSHARTVVAGCPLNLLRVDETAEPGFLLTLDAAIADATATLSALSSAITASAPSATRVSPEEYAAFRIDAGTPLYGTDLSDEHLAQEADRTEQAISFKKGCYLGQEPIARLDALGHVNRMLRVVEFEGPLVPEAGDRVIDAESGADLGALTSVGRLPASTVVGLGMLRVSAPVGRPVQVQTAAGVAHGMVAKPARRAATSA